MKNVKIPWKNGCFLPLSRHEWQVMGLKKVFYSCLVPEMIWYKFHETEVPKLTYPSLLWLAEWKVPAPLQIQTRSLKRGRRGATVTATRRELSLSLPRSNQLVGNDQLTWTSTWQQQLLPCQSAGPRQSSIQINFWYLCCKLIYNDIAPLDKQIMSFINSLSPCPQGCNNLTLQLVKPNQR